MPVDLKSKICSAGVLLSSVTVKVSDAPSVASAFETTDEGCAELVSSAFSAAKRPEVAALPDLFSPSVNVKFEKIDFRPIVLLVFAVVPDTIV